MKHEKHIDGHPDLQKLAEDLGNLRYDSLSELFMHLSEKLRKDSIADSKRKRPKLARKLEDASNMMEIAAVKINSAWKISKPYMENGNEKHD